MFIKKKLIKKLSKLQNFKKNILILYQNVETLRIKFLTPPNQTTMNLTFITFNFHFFNFILLRIKLETK